MNVSSAEESLRQESEMVILPQEEEDGTKSKGKPSSGKEG